MGPSHSPDANEGLPGKPSDRQLVFLLWTDPLHEGLHEFELNMRLGIIANMIARYIGGIRYQL